MKKLFLFLLLTGCARHVVVQPPARQTDEWTGPFYASDHSYAYYTNSHGEWVVISKTGPEKARRDLCPKGAICSTGDLGQMYSLKRSN